MPFCLVHLVDGLWFWFWFFSLKVTAYDLDEDILRPTLSDFVWQMQGLTSYSIQFNSGIHLFPYTHTKNNNSYMY